MTSKAEIHDLGYAAYRGPRTPPSRRFWVIAKNVFGVAWKSRWGVKVPFLMAGGTTFAAAVVMWVARDKLFDMVRARGAPIPKAEQIIFFAFGFYQLAGFLLGAVVACAAIANDLRLGAFQFYFSRPLRPRDYVAGKLLGLAFVVGVPMLCGPVVLAIVRLLLADDVAQALSLSPVLGQAAALGILGTAAIALPAAALGALIGKRQPAQAMFVVYFVVLATAASGLSRMLDFSYLALLDIGHDLDVVGRALFGVALSRREPDPLLAAAALAIIGLLSFAVIWRRVARAETASLGGG